MSENQEKNEEDLFSKEDPNKNEPDSIKAHESNELKKPSPRGRPQVLREEWTKVTVVLLDRQIHWLDRLAADIRLNTKCAISRAEIIRAVITAIEKSGIDLSEVGSEKEIAEKLLKNFLV